MKKGIIAVRLAVVAIVLVAAYLLFLKPAGPEDTVLAARDAMNDRDVDTLYSLYSSWIQEVTPKWEFANLVHLLDEKGLYVDEIEILHVKVKNSTATVRAKMTVEPEIIVNNIPLVLEAGEWKLTEWPYDWFFP